MRQSQGSEVIKMDSILNFRQLGGYRDNSGKSIKEGTIFRSGSLDCATKDDLRRLSLLGIRTICDLRADIESKAKPDRLPKDSPVRYINVSVSPKNIEYMIFHKRVGALLTGKFRGTDFHQVMIDQYADFVLLFNVQFSNLLSVICQKENLPVLIHCTGGKDRTGFACALILAILGFPKETIQQDYLLSNEYRGGFEKRLNSILLFMRLFGMTREKLMPLIEVNKEFLDNSFQTIKREYGSFKDYLDRGLALDDGSVNCLRSILMG